jgi:hypothetical protein
VVEPDVDVGVVVDPGVAVGVVVVEAGAAAPGPLESQPATISAAAITTMTRTTCRRRQKAGVCCPSGGESCL